MNDSGGEESMIRRNELHEDGSTVNFAPDGTTRDSLQYENGSILAERCGSSQA